MSDLAIRVTGLGKQYRIGSLYEQRYRTLRDSLAGLFDRSQRQSPERIWALKDISFDVRRGQVLGVSGRNGAG